MKKAISALMLIMVLVASFVSCTNGKKPDDDTVLATDGVTSGTSDTDNSSVQIKTIRYTPEKEFENFNLGKESAVQQKVTVIVQIPDSWFPPEENEISDTYEEWNVEAATYMRRLTFSELFRVPKNFILDESVYSQDIAAASFENPDMFTPESGTTDSGYQFTMYKREIGNNFRYVIYLRISDDYIFKLEYAGNNNANYEQVRKSLNSIKFEVE